METLYKCPWCGHVFENGKDLHLHAKKHYNQTSPLKTVAKLDRKQTSLKLAYP
jgi:uncharacterized C2H2 Zn-finger protein